VDLDALFLRAGEISSVDRLHYAAAAAQCKIGCSPGTFKTRRAALRSEHANTCNREQQNTAQIFNFPIHAEP
jgi:hypothetical protein